MKRLLQIFLGCCAIFFCAAAAFPQVDTSYSCAWSRQWLHANPQNQAEAIETYDSLRIYVKNCAANDDQSYEAFSPLDGAVALYSNDPARFDGYRDWLISAINLNTTNPAYFCACLHSISGTYGYSNITNAGLAVLNYLRQNPHCDGSGLENEYQQDSLYNLRHGIGMHLPPLDSIGLGFLLKNSAPSSNILTTSTSLASFVPSQNPFVTETTLAFTLSRMSYITLAVYDDLGRLVWGDGRGNSLETGTHSIQIDGSKFPSGTLYARIATGFGEVKTVKLVHEK